MWGELVELLITIPVLISYAVLVWASDVRHRKRRIKNCFLQYEIDNDKIKKKILSSIQRGNY